jgi:uncharacterized integral membrane protein
MRRPFRRSTETAATPETDAPPDARQGKRRELAVYLGLTLLVAYVVAFVIENSKRVSVHFVVGSTRARVIWVILLSVGIGLVAGLLLPQLRRRRRRQQRG